VGLLRWPLAYVLLGTGLLACGWAYLQLAKQAVHAGEAP
jgi:chromate transporter